MYSKEQRSFRSKNEEGQEWEKSVFKHLVLFNVINHEGFHSAVRNIPLSKLQLAQLLEKGMIITSVSRGSQ